MISSIQCSHELTAMAKRLIEYYPMLRDRSAAGGAEWMMDELQRILNQGNSHFLPELKNRWATFCEKVQFMEFSKKS
ncbi:hypothetical protein D9C73_022208 [Collichthys lucidus]|uniref:Uncharacterized protein n=1 Tax=Collichthys lucidus TaxID=240159 RepID=A0A4U5VIC2_COLLU|nr:hypothetical protein D9C73_022208 [Collichthys lucidus]